MIKFNQNLVFASYRQIRRMVVGLIGGAVLLFGVALIVLPGPAILVVPAGLAILATEFDWAKNLLNGAKRWVNRVRKKERNSSSPRS